MPDAAGTENYAQFVKQSIEQLTEKPEWFENECPVYSAFDKNFETKNFTHTKGFQMPYVSRRPGGHTVYTPSNSSFNQVVSGDTKSMYVYPTRYALPMVFQGALLMDLKQGNDMALMSYDQLLNSYLTTATKRLEIFCVGDGSAALAYSASSLAATGSGQTMNCTTTAAATPGQTKGALYLEEGHTYQAINTSTEAVRGTILVETSGTSSAVVNVTSGSVASGDRIVDVNANQRAPRGLGDLISKTARLLQGLNTANYRDLNSPEIDLNGALCTPADFDDGKTKLQTRNNMESAENQLINFCTFASYSRLKQQGWNLTIQSTTQTTGIAKKYVDGDTMFIRAADMDEDRHYMCHPKVIKMFEQKKLGPINLDNQELRMLMGDNGTGSEDYQRAIGAVFNPGVTLPRGTLLIKRGAVNVSQVSSY